MDRVQEDVRRLPPVDRVIRAGLESKELGDAEPIAVPYQEDAGCGQARCSDGPSDCPWLDLGGQYRLIFNSANFNFHEATISDSQDTQNFFNQRFRTWLMVRPNDRVEGYLQAEMGHVAWSENLDFPHTFVGPRFPPADDRVGVELRRGYIKVNPTSGSADMGTELVQTFTVDLGGGLTADLGAAVLLTGDFYKPSPFAPSPETLWEVFSRVQLEF